MKTTDQTASADPTPYIAVAANYFGTGKSAQEARKTLAKAGGSPQEPQTVFKLPDGATGAYMGDDGHLHWGTVEGEARPVFKYVNGKAVAWAQGEDQPIPFKKPSGKTKPVQNPDAQELGSDVEVDTTDKEFTIASTDLPKASKPKPSKKPAKVDASVDPAPGTPATDTTKRKPSKKPAPIVEAAEPETVGESAQEPADAPVAQGSGPDGKPGKEVTARGRAISDKAKKAATPQVPALDGMTPLGVKPSKSDAKVADGDAADFLLFVGGSMYPKDVFIKEASELGISRRMPSHRLPKGLVCGKSKVYIAAEGLRKTDGEPTSEVFGYFIPSAVHFIQGSDKKQFADIVAALKSRTDTKIINSISGEPERACGFRQTGGTYIVVDKADSPLKLLDKPAQYVGNHFRGLLRLNDLQARQFNTGGKVTTLVEEKCMKCGDAMKCAPDGHARAERERKRIERGEEPKWLLLDAKCQKALRAERAADDGPQSADENQGQPEANEAAE